MWIFVYLDLVVIISSNVDFVVIISSNRDFIEYTTYSYLLYFAMEGHDDACLPVMLLDYINVGFKC